MHLDRHDHHHDRRLGRLAWCAAAVGAAAITAALAAPSDASGHDWSARAVLRDPAGRRVGVVRFEGIDHGTDVKVTVQGVAEGFDAFHGLHVHANVAGTACDGSTSPPFTNVGPHWTPTGALHGRHEGDLPPVLVQADGTGSIRTTTARFEPAALVGRAVILHAGADNLANVPTRYVTGTPPVAGPDTATNGTGDAGARLACGVITRG